MHQVNINSREKTAKRYINSNTHYKTYFGFCKEKVAIFVQHSLGPFQQVARDPLKLIIHCAQGGKMNQHKKNCLYLGCIKAAGFFFTSLIIFRRVGSSLVEMIRQQSMKCVLERVKRGAVVWVEH